MKKARGWARLSGIVVLIAGSGLLAFHPAAAGASNITIRGLRHDTRSLTYRSPFGAVAVGQAITLALRTGRGQATGVTLQMVETDQAGNPTHTFNVSLKRTADGNRYDLWKGVFTPPDAAMYHYDFKVKTPKGTVWYSANQLNENGLGQEYTRPPNVTFELTAYDPAFQTPSWLHDAVVYQIFPDRFYDGDTSNDIAFHSSVPVPAVNGTCPAGSYDYEASPADGYCAYTHTSWSQLPENPAHDEDFFGGDLQGIIDKLPYLKSLGVTVLYLNPIFESPSNHKYDTSDFMTIDPHFGTLADFEALVNAAHDDGMHVILDGVFNDTGNDSIYFNEYGHFSDVGAYQSKGSPYYSWYTFFDWPTSYSSWSGYPTLPLLNENDAVKDFIFRSPGSVALHWLSEGADGWRLDSADTRSHTWWQEFRQSVKAKFPDSAIICECSGGPIDATPWLLGNEMDGVLNYRFQDAMLHFFAADVPGSSYLPSTVHDMYDELEYVLEEYPTPAIQSTFNIVDSQDTARILTLLGNSIPKLKEVATIQMTWVGAPTVYYGDETGLQGQTDPDDRRTFPWGNQNTGLENFYRSLIGLRLNQPALSSTQVQPLVMDDKHRVFAYLRGDPRASNTVVVAINDERMARTVMIPLKGSPVAAWSGNDGKTYQTQNGSVSVRLGKFGALVLTAVS